MSLRLRWILSLLSLCISVIAWYLDTPFLRPVAPTHYIISLLFCIASLVLGTTRSVRVFAALLLFIFSTSTFVRLKNYTRFKANTQEIAGFKLEAEAIYGRFRSYIESNKGDITNVDTLLMHGIVSTNEFKRLNDSTFKIYPFSHPLTGATFFTLQRDGVLILVLDDGSVHFQLPPTNPR